MAEQQHYYSPMPQAKSQPHQTEIHFAGRAFTFFTDAGVFSKGGLDAGSRILLNSLPDKISGRILDFGCGWGALGIIVKTLHPACDVLMADVNARAVSLTQRNAIQNGVQVTVLHSDGFADIHGFFDAVLTNPPIRAGKDTIYRLFAQAEAQLLPGGQLYIVIRKQQGAPSALAYLNQLFTQAQVIDRSGGYWVIRCQKGLIDHV